MDIFVLQGDHPTTPGRVMSAWFVEVTAHVEAAKLLNVMLADVGMAANATAQNWERRLSRMKAKGHDGDVWITPLRVQD